MNPKMFSALSANPAKFPKHLLKGYQRVLDRISDAWGTDAADALFADLLVADSESRQGFPPEVMSEILALSKLHDQCGREPEQEEADPWAAERDMTPEEAAAFAEELERSGRPFKPETFFKAVEQGETRLACDFVRAGMDIDVRRADEWTPLMVALFNGNEETAMMLLSRGANVRARDKRGYEPLHWAAFNGYARAVQFILRKGGNVNAPTDYGWTPLLQAASRGYLEIVRLLLKQGASVDAAEVEGWTALHKACANGHVEVVKALMHAGADAQQAAKSGATPMGLAMKHKNLDLMEALTLTRAAQATDPLSARS